MLSSRLSVASLCLVFCVTIATSAWAQTPTFQFTALDDPAGFNTEPRSINSSGEIAGFYQTDTSCQESVIDIRYIPNCKKHGFTYLNGTYTTLDVPGGVSTVVNGVNDKGDLVGIYVNSDNSIHGFLWLHTGTIQTLDDGSNVVIPLGVNRSLTIVGEIGEKSFRWSRGKFALLPVVSGPGCPSCNGASGIANNGTIVGFAFKHDFWVGYLLHAGDRDYLPKFNGVDSFLTDVNDHGDIVGYGSGNGYFAPGFEGNEGSGDKEKAPAYSSFVYPGGWGTTPFGINDSRSVVGVYFDNQGWHGFFAAAQ